MAGLGRKTFIATEVLTAANVNGYLMDQSVMKFADSTARSSAIGTAVSEGMVSYLADTDALEVYNGSSWGAVSSSSSGNAIINGAFDIWQRGTSFSASGYTADRWAFDLAGGTGSVTQQTFTPGTAPVAGYEGTYFLRKNMTTGAQYSSILQRIEDVRSFAGQTVTVSFWAKGTNPTGNFYVNLLQNFGTGGSTQVGIGDQTLTVTGSWVRYTMQFIVPSVSGKTIGTGSNLWLTFYQAAANTSVSTFDIWGVQLEAGSVATPFKRNAPSIQGELAACQRYYYRITPTETTRFGLGIGSSTTQVVTFQQFPVQMRATPTSVEYANLSVSDEVTTRAITSLGMFDKNPLTCMFAAGVASGITQFRPYVLFSTNLSAYIGVSAELL